MLQTVKRFARQLLKPPLHKPEAGWRPIILGTEYGSWPLLQDYTNRGALVYSFGIGEDISFDLTAIDTFGCRVIGFDPTPRSLEWLKQQKLPALFEFYPIGIAARDGEAEFFAPAIGGHVSYSASPASVAHQITSITAQVLRLETIITRLRTPPPEILKLDIEGFEYDVISDILEGPFRPQQFLVEFHHGLYGISTERTNIAVEALRAAGYRLFYVSAGGHEYGFVLSQPQC